MESIIKRPNNSTSIITELLLQQLFVKCLNSLCLGRETKFLALQDFSDVKIEEIAVKDGLDTSGNNCNKIKESLTVISPDPVDQVEATVKTQSKQVMSGNGLSFSSFADHEQLRQDGNTFQINTEGPQNFKRSKLMIYQES